MTDPLAWQRVRAATADAVRILSELLEDSMADDRRLVMSYLEVKQTLAQAFETFAAEKYSDDEYMRRALSLVETAMRKRYARMPARYLRTRGYGEAQTRILAYLAQRVGQEVSVAELRMLTGDAVHTERRTRELRELGFLLVAKHTGGSDRYVLLSAEPDLVLGSARQLARNVRADRTLDAGAKQRLLRLADSN